MPRQGFYLHHRQQQHVAELWSIPEDKSISFSAARSTETSVSHYFPSNGNRREESFHDTSLELVNRDRMALGIPPLRASRHLNKLATHHAQLMAGGTRLVHAVDTIASLQNLLGSDLVASNVQRGDSVLDMHVKTMMHYPANRHNILSGKFNEFGVGIARGQDGLLYNCQYFRHG